MQHTYQARFFHCSKQFLMSFGASAVFCFSSSTSTKCFLLRNFVIWGNKKAARGEIGWIRRLGPRGHAIFGQKLLDTQHGVGRCAHKPPIMKWANAWKEPSKKKNPLKPNSASHHNASWCTGPDGFLEHPPSRGSLYYKGPALQKIIRFF